MFFNEWEEGCQENGSQLCRTTRCAQFLIFRAHIQALSYTDVLSSLMASILFILGVHQIDFAWKSHQLWAHIQLWVQFAWWCQNGTQHVDNKSSNGMLKFVSINIMDWKTSALIVFLGLRFEGKLKFCFDIADDTVYCWKQKESSQ